MSGHSKWSQIKRQKAVTDLKKGQVFSQYAKKITLAAKEGGGDAEMNFKLRMVIEKAKAAGMPNDNIERAIKRGTGEDKSGAALVKAIYEGLGPHGSNFIVETATDNTNRTLGDIRHIFTKFNGRLADSGSVSWMYQQRGLILATATPDKIDSVILAAIDSGAEDVINREEGMEIYTKPQDLKKVKDAVETAGAKIITAEQAYVAKQTIDPTPSEREQVTRLSEALEFNDDVVAVHDNLS